MALIWQANADVVSLMNEVKSKYHDELKDAQIAVAFSDSKAFVRNRFNFGKVAKFNNFAKLWQNNKYNLAIILVSDVWHDLLNNDQRVALIDLHLSRCKPQYLPEFQEVNGKKVPIKDEYGRIEYSKQFKTDDEGNVQYQVLPLDLFVFAENIKRFGLWLPDFSCVKEALEQSNA